VSGVHLAEGTLHGAVSFTSDFVQSFRRAAFSISPRYHIIIYVLGKREGLMNVLRWGEHILTMLVDMVFRENTEAL
jgi:hypothetical protein